ncbi:hypothetical protein [Streptomyces sp. IBSBF 2390]
MLGAGDIGVFDAHPDEGGEPFAAQSWGAAKSRPAEQTDLMGG